MAGAAFGDWVRLRPYSGWPVAVLSLACISIQVICLWGKFLGAASHSVQCLLEGRLIEAGFPIATVTSCMHRQDSTDHRPMYRQRLTEHLRPCETFRSWPAWLIWIWLVSHGCCNQSKCFCDFIVCVTFVGTCAWLVWLQVVRKGCVMCGRLSSLKLDSDIEVRRNIIYPLFGN